MNRKELLQSLDRTKTYTAEEVAEFLESELIRCTGHMNQKVIELVDTAFRKRNSTLPAERETAFIYDHAAIEIRLLSNGIAGLTGLDDPKDDSIRLKTILKLYPFLKTGQ